MHSCGGVSLRHGHLSPRASSCWLAGGAARRNLRALSRACGCQLAWREGRPTRFWPSCSRAGKSPAKRPWARIPPEVAKTHMHWRSLPQAAAGLQRRLSEPWCRQLLPFFSGGAEDVGQPIKQAY